MWNVIELTTVTWQFVACKASRTAPGQKSYYAASSMISMCRGRCTAARLIFHTRRRCVMTSEASWSTLFTIKRTIFVARNTQLNLRVVNFAFNGFPLYARAGALNATENVEILRISLVHLFNSTGVRENELNRVLSRTLCLWFRRVIEEAIFLNFSSLANSIWSRRNAISESCVRECAPH